MTYPDASPIPSSQFSTGNAIAICLHVIVMFLMHPHRQLGEEEASEGSGFHSVRLMNREIHQASYEEPVSHYIRLRHDEDPLVRDRDPRVKRALMDRLATFTLIHNEIPPGTCRHKLTGYTFRSRVRRTNGDDGPTMNILHRELSYYRNMKNLRLENLIFDAPISCTVPSDCLSLKVLEQLYSLDLVCCTLYSQVPNHNQCNKTVDNVPLRSHLGLFLGSQLRSLSISTCLFPKDTLQLQQFPNMEALQLKMFGDHPDFYQMFVRNSNGQILPPPSLKRLHIEGAWGIQQSSQFGPWDLLMQHSSLTSLTLRNSNHSLLPSDMSQLSPTLTSLSMDCDSRFVSTFNGIRHPPRGVMYLYLSRIIQEETVIKLKALFTAPSLRRVTFLRCMKHCENIVVDPQIRVLITHG